MRGKHGGISLQNVAFQEKQGWNTLLLELAVSLLLTAGFLQAFLPFFPSGDLFFPFLLIGAITACLLTGSRKFPFLEKKLRFLIAGLCLFLGIWLFSDVMAGFFHFVNQIVTAWNVRYDAYYRLFSEGTGSGQAFYMLLTVAAAAFSCMLVRKERFGLLTAAAFSVLFLCFILKTDTRQSALLCLTGGWLLSWGSFMNKRTGSWKAMAFLGIFLLLFVGAEKIISGGELDTVTRMQKTVKQEYHNFRYGKDSLPKGEFQKAGDMLQSDKERLRVTFLLPCETYLRGFVGSLYSESGWKELSGAAYTGKQDGLYWKTGNPQLEASELTVENKGADREYFYAPVTLLTVEQGAYREKKDWQLCSKGFFGSRNYKFSFAGEAAAAETAVLDPWFQNAAAGEEQSYVTSEETYRTFVYKNYLALSDEQTALCGELFFGEDWDGEDAALYEIASRIRTVLGALASYEKLPVSVPEGKDFVSWFLKEGKEGNSVYFSTAAVLAFRSAGIPARYAEGYYISESRAEQMKKKGEYAASLTEQDAHAWVEVYLDGMGWLPLEVTPGFYQEEYEAGVLIETPNQVVGASGINQDPSANGVLLEDYNTGQKQEEPILETPVMWDLVVYWILAGIVGTAIVFIACLELQRSIRLRIRIRRKKGEGDEERSRFLYDDFNRLIRCQIGKKEALFPSKLTSQIDALFPGVEKQDFERVLEIWQKTVFGGKPLRPHEFRKISSFLEAAGKAVYQDAGVRKTLLYRYFLCI